MEEKYVKMEEEKQKPFLDYISSCSKEDSSSKISQEKIDNPKISIIIPIYNGEKNIIPTIRSVQNQTLKEIEIMCINDNSTDNTGSILNKLKKEDPRITIISNKFQREPLYNFINGGTQAKGEYVTFLNQEDYLITNDILFNVYEIATKKYEEKIDIINYQSCGAKYNKDNIESLMSINTINLNYTNKLFKKPEIIENYLQNKREITESRFVFDKIYKKDLIQKIADYIGPQIWNQKLLFGFEFLFCFSSMKFCNSIVTIQDIGYCHKIKDISFMWEIEGDNLKHNVKSNKYLGDYMLVLERILLLTEKEKELGEFRENIIKELIEEKYLKAIGRSIYYDKYITLVEKIYNWKFSDKDTKKRTKENLKTIIKYKIDSKNKFIKLLGV